MNKNIPTSLPCPQCQKVMKPVSLVCETCELQVSGNFDSHPLMSLTESELHFLHIFIHCEGKISDMEKALGISYPTVKSKLNKLKNKITAKETPMSILAQMENGELEYQSGLNKIKKLKKKKEIEIELKTEEKDKENYNEKTDFKKEEQNKFYDDNTKIDLSNLGSFVSKAMKEVEKGFSETHLDDKVGKNNVTLSRLDKPVGEKFSFDNNSIQVSNINDLRLENSKMNDNSIQAGHMNSIHLKNSLFNDCEIQGSALDQFNVTDSKLTDVSFQGTKSSRSTFNDSILSDVEFQGANFKNFNINKQTKICNSKFMGLNINLCLFSATLFADTELQGCSFKDSTMSSCEFHDCHFVDVKISECEISNVILNDRNLKNIYLNGKVITSTEEFLKLC
jgi:uncharacterized protein YjbI with pentapeptide repeats